MSRCSGRFASASVVEGGVGDVPAVWRLHQLHVVEEVHAEVRVRAVAVRPHDEFLEHRFECTDLRSAILTRPCRRPLVVGGLRGCSVPTAGPRSSSARTQGRRSWPRRPPTALDGARRRAVGVCVDGGRSIVLRPPSGAATRAVSLCQTPHRVTAQSECCRFLTIS